ncbi:MAG: hypothetical protein ABSG44_11275 [Thermodesulfobacteriota bacterium]
MIKADVGYCGLTRLNSATPHPPVIDIEAVEEQTCLVTRRYRGDTTPSRDLEFPAISLNNFQVCPFPSR